MFPLDGIERLFISGWARPFDWHFSKQMVVAGDDRPAVLLAHLDQDQQHIPSPNKLVFLLVFAVRTERSNYNPEDLDLLTVS